MNAKYDNIIISFFFILPFIFYYLSTWYLYSSVEGYQTANGCYWKYLEGPCTTSKFSPSMVNIVNKDYKRNCGKYQDDISCIGEDNIITDEEEQYYYCHVDGQCKKRLIDIKHPAANNCGYNNSSEQNNIAYLTDEQCNKSIDICEEHNHSKQKCLKQSLCGWCTGAHGKGRCASGSPIGANNPKYKCKPQTGQNIYNWTYGQGLSISPLEK
jgi:hypothetical protein